jgi:peptidylprolyl isomerase
MLRRALLLLLIPALVLSACGDSEDTIDTSETTTTTAEGTDDDGGGAAEPSDEDVAALDGVEVSGADGEKPTLEFDQPLTVGATVRKVLTEGDGEEIVTGASVSFDFLFINARDGSEYGSSYESEPAQVTVDANLLVGARVGLTGLRPGSRAIVAIAPDDGFGPQGGDPDNGLEPDDTLLFLVEVHEVRIPLLRAEGTAVEPVDGQPTVTLDDDGAPTITVPGGEPPAELIAQPLIEGEGAVVETGQTITVHYTGVLWDTGEVFDSSWEGGSPASFPIGTGGVIPGWDKGLVGRTVGSQILLVIPPADGYGDQGSGQAIPGGATLVFVVDILDAHA